MARVVGVVTVVAVVAVVVVVVVETRRVVQEGPSEQQLQVGITMAKMTLDLLWHQTAVPQLAP